MEGWIKLYRISLDHWLYTEKRPLTRREAWENILILVNREDDKALIQGTLIDCNRGQSIQSLQTWANSFNWSVQMVRTFFKLLENDNMIVIEGMQKTTRLTVCNYGKYQDIPTDKQQTDNTQITHRQQTDNRQITTNKNIKKNKNIRNKEVKNKSIDFSFISVSFLPVWEKWLEYRKEVKKPYKTESGMKSKYNELVTLSGDDPSNALLIVQQGIDNEWIGFFPLKKNGKNLKGIIPGEDPVEKIIREANEFMKNKQTSKSDGIQK
jgi:hypothetical protein